MATQAKGPDLFGNNFSFDDPTIRSIATLPSRNFLDSVKSNRIFKGVNNQNKAKVEKLRNELFEIVKMKLGEKLVREGGEFVINHLLLVTRSNVDDLIGDIYTMCKALEENVPTDELRQLLACIPYPVVVNSLRLSANRMNETESSKFTDKLEELIGLVEFMRGQYVSSQNKLAEACREIDYLKQSNEELKNKLNNIDNKLQFKNINFYKNYKSDPRDAV